MGSCGGWQGDLFWVENATLSLVVFLLPPLKCKSLIQLTLASRTQTSNLHINGDQELQKEKDVGKIVS